MSKTELNGSVVLGFGPQPMDWISKVAKLCGSDAVMDPTVARMAGANLAGGTPAALAALRKRLEAGALEAEQHARPNTSAATVRWLANGERGLSSEAMFTCLTGIDATDGSEVDRIAHPYDPADFRRCRLLLEAAPELAGDMVKLRSLSEAWRNLVDNWAEICATMDAEAPKWRDPERGWSCPKTYDLIKRAIGR